MTLDLYQLQLSHAFLIPPRNYKLTYFVDGFVLKGRQPKNQSKRIIPREALPKEGGWVEKLIQDAFLPQAALALWSGWVG